jgi:hypothetical protein
MSERWWVLEDDLGLVQRVFKGEFNDDDLILDEQVWNPIQNVWVPTTSISKWMFVGHDDLREVTREEAVRSLPAKALAVEKALDRDEIKTFLKFVAKNPKRQFEFTAVPEIIGEVLNKFVGAGDYDSARRYAERYLS